MALGCSLVASLGILESKLQKNSCKSLLSFVLLQVPQACSVQPFPVPYGFPSLLSSDQQFLLPHPPHLSHHPPHLPVTGQFLHFQTQQPQAVSDLQ